jgi:ABC-2 type transport system permease protein
LVLVFIEAVFVLGIALALSVFNVYFRDVQYFVFIMFQVLFYTVPVVYPITYVPVHATVGGVQIPVLYIYRLNPLVRIVESFRAVLYDLRFPPALDVLYVVAWAVGLLAIGAWIFAKLERRLAEEV